MRPANIAAADTVTPTQITVAAMASSMAQIAS